MMNHNKPVMDLTQFTTTKKIFKEYTEALGAVYPLDFDAWDALPDEAKAAALFVNFFDIVYPEIVAGFNKGYSWCDDFECIHHLMDRFVYNVCKGVITAKTFNGKVMRTIIRNCYKDIGRIVCEKNRAENDVSNVSVTSDGDEIDIFQSRISDLIDVAEEAVSKDDVYAFWKAVDGLDNDSLAMIDHILNGKALGKKRLGKHDEIISVLRKTLAPFRSIFMHELDDDTVLFCDVYDAPNVESVVATMRDGKAAVYCGEKHVDTETGKISVVFMGDQCDYIIPLAAAHALVVRDIETN